MDPNLPGSLEEQLADLRSRVLGIEEALRSSGVVPQKATATPPPSAFVSAAQVPQNASAPPPPISPDLFGPPIADTPASIPPPRFGFQEPTKPAETRSLESRVGSQWFNRIGILAILIGMAWFLKFAIDNHWIGPLGRVLIGLAAGSALIAWSERFRAKNYVAFAYSLKAAGSGILYLSLWAAFSLYHLIPASLAFLAMLAITAFNGYLAWIQDSELLALYAIVGGLSTPILVSTGENHEVTLFSYLLMLDLAVLVLVALRPWSRLLMGAYFGTVIFVFGWWTTFYNQAQAPRTAFFLVCFFLIFALAPRLVRLNLNERTSVTGWDQLLIAVLPIANAALGFIAFYNLFPETATDWAGPWLAVAFAAFYLLLLRVHVAGKLHDSPPILSALHLTTAVVFLTIAIPLKAHGRWLCIGWLVEGAALLWVSTRVNSKLLRVLSMLCLVLGLFTLLVVNPDASTVPFFNERFGTHLVAIVVFAFVAWLAHTTGARSADNQIPWPTVVAAALLVVNALILVAISWEIHAFWWNRNWHGDYVQMHFYRMYAQFTYSAFFMAFGALLLAIGFWRRSAFYRWQALFVLAASIGKVFLIDTDALSQGFRILSFLGLGALLLGVSFVYQRDWLNLRSHGGETS